MSEEIEQLPADVVQRSRRLVVIHPHAALHGHLHTLGRHCGAVELCIEADRQRTEAPHAGFASDEVPVARVLHRALADLEAERGLPW